MAHKTFDELLDAFDPYRGLEDSRTPPYTWYCDPAFFEQEQARIFQKCWIPVGQVDQCVNPGDHFTGEIVGRT